MRHRYLKNVATLAFNEGKCNGCGICLDVCPHAVLVQAGKKIEIRDKDACMECGACAMNCPFGALFVQTGVGCAAAIIWGALTGKEPTCGGNDGCCS
ncbi:MAG: mercury methylation ferredoxin HgcB [Syntrophomonadaceae bacterium]